MLAHGRFSRCLQRPHGSPVANGRYHTAMRLHSSSKPLSSWHTGPQSQHAQQLQLQQQHQNQQFPKERTSPAPSLPVLLGRLQQLGAALALAGLWLLTGRPVPATAAMLPRPVETMVAMTPPAAAVSSGQGPNDSMLMIVAVCLGFWTLSATISAAIGALMKMSGRSLQYGSRGAATWTSAGILDTLDIMRLPLAYEIEEPSRAGGSKTASKVSGGSVTYVPWEGPAMLIPVSLVKVLRPGQLEAGLVARPALLQPDQNLSIISIDKSGKASNSGGEPQPNGNSKKSNGNGNANGSGTESGSGNGNGKQQPSA